MSLRNAKLVSPTNNLDLMHASHDNKFFELLSDRSAEQPVRSTHQALVPSPKSQTQHQQT